MNPPAPNSPDLLCAQIIADATRESEEIRQRAQKGAESTLATASAEAEKIRREQQEQAQAEAARRRGLILTTATVETSRMRSARVESLLESIHDDIRRQLLARNVDGREIIVALAAEAIRRMPANDLVLKISAASLAAFSAGLAADVSRRADRSALNLAIIADATVIDGGVVIESADGGQIWDNRLSTRLERLWPALRREIAARTALVSDEVVKGGGT